jgi:hypothetical protein
VTKIYPFAATPFFLVGPPHNSREITIPPTRARDNQRSVSVRRIMTFLSQMSTSVEEEPRHGHQSKAEKGEDASSPVNPDP